MITRPKFQPAPYVCYFFSALLFSLTASESATRRAQFSPQSRGRQAEFRPSEYSLEYLHPPSLVCWSILVLRTLKDMSRDLRAWCSDIDTFPIQ